MNRGCKTHITAFLLSCGMLLGVIGGIMLIAWIGVLLKDYLPYITIGIVFLLFAGVMSIPVREALEDRERRKEYQRKKDEERIRNNWKPNLKDYELDRKE